MRRLLVCWMVLLAGCTGSGGPIQVMEGLGQAGDLFFLDSQHGWVVGEDTNAKKGLIAASSDGGRSWELTRVDTEGTLLGVAFRDAQHGRVFGSHAGAFVTQDGGKTWTPEEAPGDVNAYSRRDGLACLTLNAPGYWRRQGILCFRADDLKRGVFREKTRTGRIFHGQDAQVVGPETAWVTTDTAIFRTTDGGKDWTAVEVGETRRGSTVVNGIVSSYFLDQDRGWLALEDGTLTVTRDGGQRREAVSAAGLEGWRVVRLHFLDQERGVALASSLSVDDAALLVTQDGGRSWQVKQQLGDHGWSELFVLDEAHAWVAGADRGVVVLAATPF